MSKYRVLIIAGGGVFGVIPAALLASKFKDAKLTDKFDCFAGTSIGGILSLAYASGMTAQNVLHDFKTMSTKAFPKPPWYRRINPFRTKHDGKGLEAVLQGMLPLDLADLEKPVVIPSIDFRNNRPKVFDTLIKNGDGKYPSWTVGRATSAAPTYFPPFQNYIDGGLMSNLPILETAAAVKHKLDIKFEDMEFLVLGTGKLPTTQRDMEKVKHWSRIRWVMPLLNFIVRANEIKSEFISKRMDFGKCEIFNPVTLEADWELDRADLVPVVEEMSTHYNKAFSKVYDEFSKK